MERQFLPERTMDDVDDPDLGAATMEEDIAGEGARQAALGSGPPSRIGRMMPRPKLFRAGPSAAPAPHGGTQKRRAASTHFGSRPKKPKSTAAATKRDEAATKAARFRKAVKQPQAISA